MSYSLMCRRVASIFLASLLSAPIALYGQQGSTQPPPADPPQQSGQAPAAGQETQTPEAGGPGGDTGAVALPKKSTKEAPPPPDVPKVTNPADIGNYSIRVDVPLVNVDVGQARFRPVENDRAIAIKVIDSSPGVRTKVPERSAQALRPFGQKKNIGSNRLHRDPVTNRST